MSDASDQSTPPGCICPPGANLTCEAPLCPRKNPLKRPADRDTTVNPYPGYGPGQIVRL